jgi:hypothetical protein
MPKAALADHHKEWFQLAAEIRRQAAEVPFLLDLADELERLLAKSSSLEVERSTLAARIQQLTRDQDAVKTRARSVASQLRAGVRSRFGYASETLAAFGMRPRRRKIARSQEEKAGAALVAPAAPKESSGPGLKRGGGSVRGNGRTSSSPHGSSKGHDGPSRDQQGPSKGKDRPSRGSRKPSQGDDPPP